MCAVSVVNVGMLERIHPWMWPIFSNVKQCTTQNTNWNDDKTPSISTAISTHSIYKFTHTISTASTLITHSQNISVKAKHSCVKLQSVTWSTREWVDSGLTFTTRIKWCPMSIDHSHSIPYSNEWNKKLYDPGRCWGRVNYFFSDWCIQWHFWRFSTDPFDGLLGGCDLERVDVLVVYHCVEDSSGQRADIWTMAAPHLHSAHKHLHVSPARGH